MVDQIEPNAFALPGGHIFISRGLLALVNTEDELANVIAHEITHASQRHSAASQAAARNQNPLAPPWMRAANMAAYSRDMERDADRGGQMLAAAAGYDPMGMSTFLASLGRWQQLESGPRGPSFFDSHPGSVERASTNAIRAAELRRRPNPALGDTRESLLAKIEGLSVGPRREGGVFVGDRFLHPSLGFQMTFPDGWRLQNTNQAVGAISRHRDAVVYLSADLPPGDLEKVGTEFLEKLTEGRARITRSQPVKLGSLDAWRIEAEASSSQGRVALINTFFTFRESTWRITGMSPALIAQKHRPRILATTRSFRPAHRLRGHPGPGHAAARGGGEGGRGPDRTGRTHRQPLEPAADRNRERRREHRPFRRRRAAEDRPPEVSRCVAFGHALPQPSGTHRPTCGMRRPHVRRGTAATQCSKTLRTA